MAPYFLVKTNVLHRVACHLGRTPGRAGLGNHWPGDVFLVFVKSMPKLIEVVLAARGCLTPCLFLGAPYLLCCFYFLFVFFLNESVIQSRQGHPVTHVGPLPLLLPPSDD